jgi:hypothetical protein
MHGLKALVGGMSLMIVICLGLLVYGLSQKAGSGGKMLETAITLPKGSIVRHTSLSGKDLALHVTAAGHEYIYVVNADKGTLLRKIEIQKEK